MRRAYDYWQNQPGCCPLNPYGSYSRTHTTINHKGDIMYRSCAIFHTSFQNWNTHINAYHLQSRYNKLVSIAFIDILPSEQHDMENTHFHAIFNLTLYRWLCRIQQDYITSTNTSTRSNTSILLLINCSNISHSEEIEQLHIIHKLYSLWLRWISIYFFMIHKLMSTSSCSISQNKIKYFDACDFVIASLKYPSTLTSIHPIYQKNSNHPNY